VWIDFTLCRAGKNFIFNGRNVSDQKELHENLEDLVKASAKRLYGVNRNLLELEEDFRDLYEFVPVMHATIDLSKKVFVKSNTYFSKVLGYSSDEIEGLSIESVWHPKQGETTEKLYKALDKSGSVHHFQHVLVSKERRQIEVLVNMIPVTRMGSDNTLYRAVFTEISNLKENERRLMHLKDELKSKVVHQKRELSRVNHGLKKSNIERAQTDESQISFLSKLGNELRLTLKNINTEGTSLLKSKLSTGQKATVESLVSSCRGLSELVQSVFEQSKLNSDDRNDIFKKMNSVLDNKVHSIKEEKLVLKVNQDLQALIPRFFRSLHLDIFDMRTAFFNSEFESIRIVSQSIGGACDSYGLSELKFMSLEIEQSAISMDRTRLISDLDKFEKYLRTVKVKYLESESEFLVA